MAGAIVRHVSSWLLWLLNRVHYEMIEAKFVELMAEYGLKDTVPKRPGRLTRHAT